MMPKNNIFDKNREIINDINYKKKHFGKGGPSYVVNLDILSSGEKSDPLQKKVGSDTRPFIEYVET